MRGWSTGALLKKTVVATLQGGMNYVFQRLTRERGEFTSKFLNVFVVNVDGHLLLLRFS